MVAPAIDRLRGPAGLVTFEDCAGFGATMSHCTTAGADHAPGMARPACRKPNGKM